MKKKSYERDILCTERIIFQHCVYKFGHSTWLSRCSTSLTVEIEKLTKLVYRRKLDISGDQSDQLVVPGYRLVYFGRLVQSFDPDYRLVYFKDPNPVKTRFESILIDNSSINFYLTREMAQSSPN